MNKNNPNILITGGSGFLGSRVVEELLSPDCPMQSNTIKVFDIKFYQGIGQDQIQFIKGDIRNYYTVEKACENIDIVIHCAAIIDWGTRSRNEVLSINVEGTKNIIRACIKNGITHIVYTSSLDAVFTGMPLVNIDETAAYPESYHSVYCESKILAEKAILQAKDDLNICILRPADIYGEADPYHIDALIDMAKTGFYVRLGSGMSKCQHVYVGNIAYAHVLAASALWNGNIKISGQVYFITDGEGVNFFKFFDQVVIGAGYKIFPKNMWLPYWLAYSIGSVSEFIAILLRPIKHYHPKFSRFAVVYTCTDFTFSANKARKDFRFIPKYSLQDALHKTITYYKKN